MAKSIVVILISLFSLNNYAQNNIGTYGSIGLNRIGVFYELGATYQKQKHAVNVGARLYEPDLVFEKNIPGIHLGYNYMLRKDRKMNVLLGANLGLFYEYKGPTNLWVFDPKLIVGPEWNLSKGFHLKLAAGIGTVINKVETNYTSGIETYTYLNYELALGLTYLFGTNISD